MKRLLTLTVAAAAGAFALASAQAGAATTTFIWEGAGGASTDTPEGVDGVDYDFGSPCAANDYCTIAPHTTGLNYGDGVAHLGITVNVKAFSGIAGGASSATSGVAARLIQDVVPPESGLGAWSETDGSADQTQFNAGESVKFTFNKEVYLSNIEFNRGDDTDCGPTGTSVGTEGPCGDFELFIDGSLVSVGIFDATDLVTNVFQGTMFEFVAVTAGGGFAIARMDVTEVPIPGALTLLLSGIAGLGFASRRKKKA